MFFLSGPHVVQPAPVVSVMSSGLSCGCRRAAFFPRLSHTLWVSGPQLLFHARLADRWISLLWSCLGPLDRNSAHRPVAGSAVGTDLQGAGLVSGMGSVLEAAAGVGPSRSGACLLVPGQVLARSFGGRVTAVSGFGVDSIPSPCGPW